jgi:hypothetical protein
LSAQGEAGDERVVGAEVARGHAVEDAERSVGEVIAEVAGEEHVVGGDGAEGHGLERRAGALHVARAGQPGDTRSGIRHRRRRARRKEADEREAHGGSQRLCWLVAWFRIARPVPVDSYDGVSDFQRKLHEINEKKYLDLLLIHFKRISYKLYINPVL